MVFRVINENQANPNQSIYNADRLVGVYLDEDLGSSTENNDTIIYNSTTQRFEAENINNLVDRNATKLQTIPIIDTLPSIIQDGQVLSYDSTTQRFEAENVNNLVDRNATKLQTIPIIESLPSIIQDGQVLSYDETTEEFQATNVGSFNILTTTYTGDTAFTSADIPGQELTFLFKSIGTVAEDDSGNGRNVSSTVPAVVSLTDSVGTTRPTTINEGVIDFSSQMSVIETFTDFSMAVWLHIPTGPGLDILTFRDNGSFRLSYNSNGSRLTVEVGSAIDAYVSITDLREQWFHFVWNTGTAGNKVYTNGFERELIYSSGNSSTTASINSLVNTGWTVAELTPKPSVNQVHVDSLYLFNRAITRDDITVLMTDMERPVELTTDPDNTVPHISLDDQRIYIQKDMVFRTLADENDLNRLSVDETGTVVQIPNEVSCINSSTLIGPPDAFDRSVVDIRNIVINCLGTPVIAPSFNRSVVIVPFGGQATGNSCINIGNRVAETTQSNNCVAIGQDCGRFNQGVGSVALGYKAGGSNLGAYSIAIGQDSGATGEYSICMGSFARSTSDYTCVLNNSTSLFTASSIGLYVTTLAQNTTSPSELCTYNNSTKAIERIDPTLTPTELGTADPVTNLFAGRTYFNTSDNTHRIYNGSAWLSSGTYT